MTVPFGRVQTGDRLTNQLQSNISQAVQAVLSLPQSKGLILTGIAVDTALTIIPHKLGRKLQGWQVIRQRSAASIFDSQDTNNTPGTTLDLTASAPVVVDLFVF